ncbi:P-II family nitrogen regulator [Croceicoccus esteveae]|uniref:P-II family nitrogen regulator n=1 Tax=Croceicoccus esteveae TaxID=3075597 RepID=UPI003D786CEA
MVTKIMLKVVVMQDPADAAIAVSAQDAHTGCIGDGKTFMLDLADALRIRTGDRDDVAM